MLSNYLKIALRSIRRHPSYTFINVTGLAVGMALCILIFLFVRDELSYDRYHAESDRIYRLAVSIENSTFDNGLAKVADLWGPGAKDALPEVENATRFVFLGRALVQRGERRQYETEGLYADSTTLQIFSWPLIAGNPETALVGPNRVVITETFAQRWFGDEDPVGEVLTIDNADEYVVTGVMRDVPANSHFNFDFLVSLETYNHEARGDWVSWNQFYTYLLLVPGATPDVVAAKFDLVLDQHLEAEYADRYYPLVQALPSIHLNSSLHREMAANSNVAYVYTFSAIAIFILLIACSNFVSLATARSSVRAQEVGIRKASGANRRMLIQQFLGESILLALLALVFSLAIAGLLMEQFNELSGKSLNLEVLGRPALVLGIVVGALAVGTVAGIYPAFVLSSFVPARVLKGDTGGSRRGGMRKGLVVFQFTISSILIIATGVVYTQLQYVQNKQLGFSKEQLVVASTNVPETRARFETVKEQLKEHPDITSVSFTSNRPGGSDWGLPLEIEGRDDNDDGFGGFRVLNVDWDFLDTYEIELLEGRGFSRDFPADSTTWLINETAARQLGWTVDSAPRIGSPRVSRPYGEVIGIVKDFHFRSMHEEIAPLIIMMQSDWLNSFSIKIKGDQANEALAHIEAVMAGWEPEFPLTFEFFDEQFDALHLAEERVGSLLTYFAVLAILIACLGLFGLASFTAERRTKEIGVRKILGASVAHILAIQSGDLARLVLVAFVIASPIAWFAMSTWMENFAYSAGISWSVFALAAVSTLSVSIVTVSYQSLRAALSDPVKSLRYE
jgi:putative ABC transport system permease protein